MLTFIPVLLSSLSVKPPAGPTTQEPDPRDHPGVSRADKTILGSGSTGNRMSREEEFRPSLPASDTCRTAEGREASGFVLEQGYRSIRPRARQAPEGNRKSFSRPVP